MKILIITTEIGLDGGGMSLSCKKIKDILSKEHDVYVQDSYSYPINTAKGGINKDTESAIKKECKLKSDIITYKDIDVIIAFGGRYNGYYASLLAERLNKRFILTLRGSDINLVKWSVDDSWYLSETCRRANKIICLSTEMIDNVISLCPSANGKIKIIQNHCEDTWKNITFPNLPNSILIGCAAAHINEKKGIANLLYMLSEFIRISNKPITLEIVVDIDSDLKCNYISIIKSLQIEDNVVFTNRNNRVDLVDIMSKWDLYIQGSICEGHPNSITECLQNGTGFISSNTGFIAELLCKYNHNKVIFNSWNPKDMAHELKSLIETPNLIQYYNEIQKLIKESCNADIIAHKWLDLFSYDTELPKDLEVEHVHCVALHDVHGDLHDSITTPVSVFEDFVNFVESNGYALCSMKKYIESSNEDRKHLIVCTFDDGYKNLSTIVKPILQEHNFCATVFICTDLIGKDNKWNNKDATLREHLSLQEIDILASAGWEIASHGVTHRNLLKLNDDEIEHELSSSKVFLDKLVGYSLTYAYPYGANNKFIQHCVEKYYKYAFAVSQGGTSLAIDRLQLRRYSISEIYKMLKK